METTIMGLGIMEKKMEATIVYEGYTGIMEKKMETTITGLYRGNIATMMGYSTFNPTPMSPALHRMSPFSP